MDMACSPTWFLIATLLVWALIAFLALAGAPYSLAAERLAGPRLPVSRRAANKADGQPLSRRFLRVRTAAAPSADRGEGI
jgi:hypothetical protein